MKRKSNEKQVKTKADKVIEHGNPFHGQCGVENVRQENLQKIGKILSLEVLTAKMINVRPKPMHERVTMLRQHETS